jgi:4-aminobutyrate aminotransferase-like enzyme
MSSPEPQTTQSETIRKHREFLFPAVAMYYQEPLALVRGEGFHVWDDQDHKYLDCFGGVLTVSVGHANPHVTAAIINQVKTLAHTSTLYANQPQSDLAEKLYQITPGNLKKSFFTNSGTEADDTAIHAAKLATGRHEIVVLRHSYSGRSATSLSAMGHSTWRPLPAQVAGIVHAPAPYCYRCPFKLTYPECGPGLCQRYRRVDHNHYGRDCRLHGRAHTRRRWLHRAASWLFRTRRGNHPQAWRSLHR